MRKGEYAYMKLLLILIFAFLILVYVYTFLKIRKRRRKKIDTVAEFNTMYKERKSSAQKKFTEEEKAYRKYITKYNSKVDYISKDDLNNPNS